MDTRSNIPIGPEIDLDRPANTRPAPPVEQTEEPQPSMLELNGILLVVLGGIAAIFTAGAFLLSHA